MYEEAFSAGLYEEAFSAGLYEEGFSAGLYEEAFVIFKKFECASSDCAFGLTYVTLIKMWSL
jgi:hypothetical protein